MLLDTSLMIKLQAPQVKFPSDMFSDFKKSMQAFLKGETGKFGNYISTQNALVYRTISVSDESMGQDILMLRLVKNGKVHYIGNSSRLNYCGTKVAFGKRTINWGETSVQKDMQAMGFPMLPFDAFTQSGLKLVDTEILDQSGAETVKRNIRQDKKGNWIQENVHFTGATLFQIGTRKFLFDIDREEIRHGIFNPFIVELPNKSNAQNITKAYESLVPSEVKQALKAKKIVLRQGEYFFIQVSDKNAHKPDAAVNDDWDRLSREPGAMAGMLRGVLSAQGNRAHVTSLFNRESGLVSGIVVHMGREHEILNINDGWYKPVPNTAVRSFTLTGDID